jgi:hypothetical protein
MPRCTWLPRAARVAARPGFSRNAPLPFLSRLDQRLDCGARSPSEFRRLPKWTGAKCDCGTEVEKAAGRHIVGPSVSRQPSKEFCFAAALKTEWWRVQSERAGF